MTCMTAANLDDATLDRLMELSRSADPPPWRSMIEGRDHTSGDSFIMIGPGHDRREDLYLSPDSGQADPLTLDLLAEARTYLPVLITEVKRLRALRRASNADCCMESPAGEMLPTQLGLCLRRALGQQRGSLRSLTPPLGRHRSNAE